MNKFLTNLTNTLDEEANISYTENGALAYRQTKSRLLDMNFKVSSYRTQSEEIICDDFAKAFYENELLALKWLFFARDVRGGLGERRLFRVILERMAFCYKPKYALKAIGLVAEYGRFDDLVFLLKSKTARNSIKKAVLKYIKEQLDKDIKSMTEGKSVSLLAKWLPSCNTSNKEAVETAKKIRQYLKLSEKDYRKTLAKLRKYSDVTEVKTCANKWGEIDYAKVPSKANLLYGNAFLKHDAKRRNSFLQKALKGTEKMNAQALFPHEIVHKYMEYDNVKPTDNNLEALWKNFSAKDPVPNAESAIVVADSSGSMYTPVDNNYTKAIEVCNALAVFFAEKLKGAFHNKFISFSERPQLLDLSQGKNLREKLDIIYSYNEVANTNIEAVFDLILKTAVKQKAKQEDLPKNILIISDMEFDEAASAPADIKLFQTIADKFAQKGYKLPRLVFWNVCSRTMSVPMYQNENGVMLVSGFSANIAQMVLDNEIDPLKCLIKTLESPRYNLVHNAYCRKKLLCGAAAEGASKK